MKNIKLKGFTLIELLVSMVVMGILMACAMQFFKPVNQLYADVYSEEKSMAIVNGVNRYIGESIRYSKYVMIYADYQAPPSKQDIIKDIRELNSSALSEAKIKDDILEGQIKGIYINNSTPVSYNGKTYTGRVYKLKDFKNSITKMALTPYYYGANSLYISIPNQKDDETKKEISSKTIKFNTILLKPDGTKYSETSSEIDFLNMNSQIQGQIGYKSDSYDNTYIYYIQSN